MNCRDDSDQQLLSFKRVELGCGCYSRHIQCLITTAIYKNVPFPTQCAGYKNCKKHEESFEMRGSVKVNFTKYYDLTKEDFEKIFQVVQEEEALQDLFKVP